MTLHTVGVISAGEMGSGFGTVLTQHGLRVLTVLGGRSAATRERAAQAGMVDVGDFDTLVRESEIFLSILPPASAAELAEHIAAAVRRTGADLLYADCNAVAPGTIMTPLNEKVFREHPDPDALIATWNRAHPIGRFGEAEEVAELVAFLASDRASFITGEIVRVDGGLVIRGE